MVANRSPVATIAGPASGAEGAPITVSANVTDPGSLDTFSYHWFIVKNYNGYTSGSGPNFTFTPDTAGDYGVFLTVVDDDNYAGATGSPLTVRDASVSPLTIVGAPANSPEGTAILLSSDWGGMLGGYQWSVTRVGVDGLAEADRLTVMGPASDDTATLTSVHVILNAMDIAYTAMERIFVRMGVGNDSVMVNGADATVAIYGDDGNDALVVAPAVISAVALHGGNGDDNLVGGSGGDSLFGDAGNDTLLGNAGDDVLVSIGGGSDTLSGGAGWGNFRCDPAATDLRTDLGYGESVLANLHEVASFYTYKITQNGVATTIPVPEAFTNITALQWAIV